MPRVLLLGWKAGLNKVGLDKLLRSEAGLSLHEAFDCVNSLLQHKRVAIDLADPAGARALADAVVALGGIAEVENPSASLVSLAGDAERMIISIRAARRADSDDVLALARPFATSFVVEDRAFRRSYAELLKAPDAYLAVAEVDRRIAGYVLGFDHPTFFANGRVAWVEEITVAARARGTGIGRMLMQEIERWAAARGNTLVALATRRAADFYLALGYEESATYFRKLL